MFIHLDGMSIPQWQTAFLSVLCLEIHEPVTLMSAVLPLHGGGRSAGDSPGRNSSLTKDG